MKQLKLKNISLVLIEKDFDVRVRSPDENVLLSGQNVENVILIIEGNFKIVDSFYLKRIEDNLKTTFDPDEIHELSISIVLDHLFMHNSWRLQYKAKKYQDLGFKDEDFNSPSIHDIIFRFYNRVKYPDDWKMKCSVLMAMELDDLTKYYERRLQYYNK